jgi:hypothetical protein
VSSPWLRWNLANFLARPALNCDLPDLCLPSSLYYKLEPLCPAINITFVLYPYMTEVRELFMISFISLLIPFRRILALWLKHSFLWYGNGVLNLGFMLVRQVICNLSHDPSPFCFTCFSDGDFWFCPGQFQITILLPHNWNYRCVTPHSFWDRVLLTLYLCLSWCFNLLSS